MREETAEGYRTLAREAIEAFGWLRTRALWAIYVAYLLGVFFGYMLGRST